MVEGERGGGPAAGGRGPASLEQEAAGEQGIHPLRDRGAGEARVPGEVRARHGSLGANQAQKLPGRVHGTSKPSLLDEVSTFCGLAVRLLLDIWTKSEIGCLPGDPRASLRNCWNRLHRRRPCQVRSPGGRATRRRGGVLARERG